MGRVDPGGIRQHQELVVQRPVQAARQRLGGQVRADRGQQVGAADVAHEQGVPGQHAVRRRIVGVFPDHHADRLGRVARRGQDLQGHLAQGQALSVVQGLDREADVGARARRR